MRLIKIVVIICSSFVDKCIYSLMHIFDNFEDAGKTSSVLIPEAKFIRLSWLSDTLERKPKK